MPSNEKVGAELNDVDAVIRYHEETKHHYGRPARSLGYMDWANQPNPFRLYEGLTRLTLPFMGKDLGAAHMDLYRREENPVRNFSLQNLSLFLELSLGISAWKSAGGNTWALRMNPSSGNLHPTEGYVVTLETIVGDPGVFHYSPYLHALEPLALFPKKGLRAPQKPFPRRGLPLRSDQYFLARSLEIRREGFPLLQPRPGPRHCRGRFRRQPLGMEDHVFKRSVG